MNLKGNQECVTGAGNPCRMEENLIIKESIWSYRDTERGSYQVYIGQDAAVDVKTLC